MNKNSKLNDVYRSHHMLDPSVEITVAWSVQSTLGTQVRIRWNMHLTIDLRVDHRLAGCRTIDHRPYRPISNLFRLVWRRNTKRISSSRCCPWAEESLPFRLPPEQRIGASLTIGMGLLWPLWVIRGHRRVIHLPVSTTWVARIVLDAADAEDDRSRRMSITCWRDPAARIRSAEIARLRLRIREAPLRPVSTFPAPLNTSRKVLLDYLIILKFFWKTNGIHVIEGTLRPLEEVNNPPASLDWSEEMEMEDRKSRPPSSTPSSTPSTIHRNVARASGPLLPPPCPSPSRSLDTNMHFTNADIRYQDKPMEGYTVICDSQSDRSVQINHSVGRRASPPRAGFYLI